MLLAKTYRYVHLLELFTAFLNFLGEYFIHAIILQATLPCLAMVTNKIPMRLGDVSFACTLSALLVRSGQILIYWNLGLQKIVPHYISIQNWKRIGENVLNSKMNQSTFLEIFRN